MQRLRFPPHGLVIDEARFLFLLAGSLSLLPAEKERIIASVPGMTQEQHERHRQDPGNGKNADRRGQ